MNNPFFIRYLLTLLPLTELTEQIQEQLFYCVLPLNMLGMSYFSLLADQASNLVDAHSIHALDINYKPVYCSDNDNGILRGWRSVF
jgi:hypothetical protein